MAELDEFLVSIGYEARNLRDFTAALERVEKMATLVAKSLARAAAALTAMVARSSAALDDLNFVSLRTGASVENLRALAYAYEQSGERAADARSALESFAETLRTKPAVEGLIWQFGVATHRNGQLRDQAEVLLDLFDKLNENPNYLVAFQQADLFGISEPQYAAMRRMAPKIRADRDAYIRDARAMGVDLNVGGASGTALMQAIRANAMMVSAAMTGMVQAVAPVLTPLIDALNGWVSAHAEEIVAAAEWIVDNVSALVEWVWSLVVSLAPLAEAFDQFTRASTGESGLVVALEAIGAVWMASIMLRLFGVAGKVRAGLLALIGAFVVGKYVAPALTGAVGGGMESGEQGGEGQSFFARVWGRARRAMGLAPKPEAGARRDGAVPASGPMLDRKSFEEELKDPAVRQRLFAVTEAEVGSQGAAAQQAFMETIFNRAKARGKTVWETLHGSYYPGSTHARAGALMGDRGLEAKYRAIYERVLGGANITNGATGNASGGVGFGGGQETFRSGGERFGVEGQDLPWWRRQQQDMKDREKRIDDIIRQTPWGSPLDQMTTPPLTTSMGDDAFSVSTTRATKITVKGDVDPHRTAQDVASAQRRVNTDMITSTSRAFA